MLGLLLIVLLVLFVIGALAVSPLLLVGVIVVALVFAGNRKRLMP